MRRQTYLVPLFTVLLATLLAASSAAAPFEVTSCHPAAGSGGTEITLLGQYFGDKKGKAYLYDPYSGKTKLEVLSWSDGSIKLRVPTNKKVKPNTFSIALVMAGLKLLAPTGYTFRIEEPKILEKIDHFECAGFVWLDGSFLGAEPKFKIGGKKAKVIHRSSLPSAPDEDLAWFLVKVPKTKKLGYSEMVVKTIAGKTAPLAVLNTVKKDVPKGKPYVRVESGASKLTAKGDVVHASYIVPHSTLTIKVKGYSPQYPYGSSFVMYVQDFDLCAPPGSVYDVALIHTWFGDWESPVGLKTHPEEGALEVTVVKLGGGRVGFLFQGKATSLSNGLPVPVEGEGIADIWFVVN